VSIHSSIIDRIATGRRRKDDAASFANSIGRDLLLLLNSWQTLPPAARGVAPEVESSVLNYGVPNLAGQAANAEVLSRYEREVEKAVGRFEPRLDPASVRVKTIAPGSGRSNAEFNLQIEGDLVGSSSGRRLVFRSKVNVSTGRVTLA